MFYSKQENGILLLAELIKINKIVGFGDDFELLTYENYANLTWFFRLTTLDSGINVAPGTFGKNIKHSP